MLMYVCLFPEDKTDYFTRIRLINRDKNMYKTPKYCYVVRFTNMDIISQVVSATTADDIVLSSAYAHEMPRYGLNAGLTNYVAEKRVVIMAEEEANKGLDYTLKVILKKSKKRDELAFINKRRSN